LGSSAKERTRVSRLKKNRRGVSRKDRTALIITRSKKRVPSRAAREGREGTGNTCKEDRHRKGKTRKGRVAYVGEEEKKGEEEKGPFKKKMPLWRYRLKAGHDSENEKVEREERALGKRGRGGIRGKGQGPCGQEEDSRLE